MAVVYVVSWSLILFSRLLLVTVTSSKPMNSSNPLLTLKHLELIWESSAWPCCGKSGSAAPTNEQGRMSCSQLLRGKTLLVHDTSEKVAVKANFCRKRCKLHVVNVTCLLTKLICRKTIMIND